MEYWTILFISYTITEYDYLHEVQLVFPTYEQCERALDVQSIIYETYDDAAAVCDVGHPSQSIKPKLRPLKESKDGT